MGTIQVGFRDLRGRTLHRGPFPCRRTDKTMADIHYFLLSMKPSWK